MFRRMILTALVGTGLTAGLTMSPAIADAHPPVERYRHVELIRPIEVCRPVVEVCNPRINVEVWRGGCWECYGSYRDRCEAERVAKHLRWEGRVVEIRG